MRQIYFILMLLAGTVLVSAALPHTLSVQGRLLTSSDVAADGQHNITFRIYNTSSGGVAMYSQLQSVYVNKSLYSAVLTGITQPFDTVYWLALQVDSDPEMSPRIEMSPSPYAYTAYNLDPSKNYAMQNLTVGDSITFWNNYKLYAPTADSLNIDSKFNVSNTVYANNFCYQNGTCVSTGPGSLATYDLTDVNSTPPTITGSVLVWNNVSQLYSPVLLNASFISNPPWLNITDQRYNETSSVNWLNQSKAGLGNCSAGQFVNGTTTTGVLCGTPSVTVPYQSSAAGWANNSTTTATNLSVLIRNLSISETATSIDFKALSKNLTIGDASDAALIFDQLDQVFLPWVLCPTGQYLTTHPTTGKIYCVGSPSNYFAGMYNTSTSSAINLGAIGTWTNITGWVSDYLFGWYRSDSQLVCNESGYYKVSYTIVFAGNAPDQYQFRLIVNGTADPKSVTTQEIVANRQNTIGITYYRTFNVGDSLGMQMTDIDANNKLITLYNRNLNVEKVKDL